MVAGNFIVSPDTAGKVLDKTTMDRRAAANLGMLKKALQDSVNRQSGRNTAVTAGGSERNNMRTNLLEIPGGNPKHNVEMVKRALEKSEKIKALTGQAYAGTVKSFGESGNVPVATGAQTPKTLATGKYVEGKNLAEIANLALKQITDTEKIDTDQDYRMVDGKRVRVGFGKEKRSTTKKVQQKVPTAQEVVSGTKQIGRGQARFHQPSAPATPTAAATPEEGQKLALQQLAASQQFRASGANPKNMKYLGNEPAGKGKIRHKWVDISIGANNQPFSLTVRSGQ